MKRIALCVCASAVWFALCSTAAAQEYLLRLPRPSPRARVMQTTGITEMTVEFGRPGVKGRRIWGGLVPYDRVWRAGADENTTIAFSAPVTVGGKHLDAGTYGIHVIPGRVYWTIILSKQFRAWGSFTYTEAEDAARVVVRPKSTPHRERLLYTFEDLAESSCHVVLSWEEKSVSFEVDLDVNATVVAELRDALRGRARNSWTGWLRAAEWCMENGVNLDEALGWIERSIAKSRNFYNVRMKALILEKQGDANRAQALMKEAVSIATESQVEEYAMVLMADGEIDRAISVLKEHVRTHPNSLRAHTSLAEAYWNRNDRANAIREYEKALALAPDNLKETIREIIERLK